MPLIRKGAIGAPHSQPAPDAAALRSDDPKARWSAARALGASADGIAPLAEALCRETDTRVREAIFTSLSRLGRRESVVALLPHLRSDDANLRAGTLDALHAMSAAVRSFLPALLHDPDIDIRILSCELVRDLDSTEATQLLCDILDTETEANVCGAALDVLAEIGNATALPSLQRCAARFRDNAFLVFAVKLTADRIAAQHPGPHA
jgi:HEAT repeat protein